MKWDESKHSRDEKGQFTSNTNLSKVEWRLYYKKLAEMKTKYGADVMKNGQIPPILIEEKLVISEGTFENPKVTEILVVDGELIKKRGKKDDK